MRILPNVETVAPTARQIATVPTLISLAGKRRRGLTSPPRENLSDVPEVFALPMRRR